jgi:hypothetical protein
MLDLGRYHLAALAQSEGTKTHFSSRRTSCKQRPQRAAEAEKAMTNPRVAVRFAENALERAIRQVALLAHGTDNKPGK